MIKPTPTKPHAPNIIRELDQRRSDGIEVTLLWNAQTRAVSVAVVEERGARSFRFEVPPGAALDAFHHPYAHATYVHNDSALAA